MISIAFPVILFVALCLAGYTVVDQLGVGYNPTRKWLLAPIAGLSIITLAGTFLNRLGFPAKVFAPPMIAILLLASGIYLALRKPQIRWLQLLIWAAAFLPALLLVGWPLLVAGTDWISFGNGDMAVYLMGADHFYEHGFYQIPPLNDLLREIDPSWDFSFYYSLAEVRSASQLDIAILMAVSHLSAARIYMVLILACHLVLLSTAAAFICSDRSRERVSYIALLVIASSANLAYGTFNQLMPQDIGIASLAACTTIFLDRPESGAKLYRRAALGGLFAAMLVCAYPELLPLLVLPILIFAIIGFIKREIQPVRWILFLFYASLATLVFANVSIAGALNFMFAQSTTYVADTTLNQGFPYYLIPSGFSVGWGFESLAPTDSYSSWQAQVLALAGAALFALALFITIRESWHLESIAIVAATMLAFLVELFLLHNGFGLFKLAMYAEPFVLGALVVALLRMPVLVRTWSELRP